jgi:hypothetical protein
LFPSHDHKVTQPTEDLILERNRELRNNKGAVQDLGSQGGISTWGRQIASIPLILWDKAIREGYRLNSRDKKEAERELHRFLNSDMGKACLIVPKLNRGR